MILEACWTIAEEVIHPRTRRHADPPLAPTSQPASSTNGHDWNRFLRIVVHAITPFPDALQALGIALLDLPSDLRGSPSSA